MNQLKVTCYDFFSVHIKMSQYWCNKEELSRKAKDRYHNCGGKEKYAKYYIENKGFLKENANNKHRNLSEEEKQI